MRRPVTARVAGAPISWGVCEVPGWGHQLPAATVLAQMREVGLAATEFGPAGFLPDDPHELARLLAAAQLAPVGQFVPLVLHDPDVDPLPAARTAIAALREAGASTMVVAAATGTTGYDTRPELDAAGWDRLLTRLDRIRDLAAAAGVTATLHPHVGTMVQTGDETDRVLAGSGILLCLDTGHLLIGGGDPVRVGVEHPHRVGHVHLKDVRSSLAAQVRSGELTYTDAVRAGLYVPLGSGDVDVAALVGALEGAGYDGWYVLEQDTILSGPPTSEGPVGDVRTSLTHLLDVAGRVGEEVS